MHELALMESVAEIAAEEARKQGACRVRVVRLQIGALAHVAPAAMRFCFEAVTRGTVVEGAMLDIVRLPGEGWCVDCARTIALEERFGACPECGGRRVRVTAGDEMRVHELEVD